jgi:hypothetical protein
VLILAGMSVDFVDHVAEKPNELGLHVVGDTPEQAEAIQALEVAQLIEITERSKLPPKPLLSSLPR